MLIAHCKALVLMIMLAFGINVVAELSPLQQQQKGNIETTAGYRGVLQQPGMQLYPAVAAMQPQMLLNDHEKRQLLGLSILATISQTSSTQHFAHSGRPVAPIDVFPPIPTDGYIRGIRIFRDLETHATDLLRMVTLNAGTYMMHPVSLTMISFLMYGGALGRYMMPPLALMILSGA